MSVALLGRRPNKRLKLTGAAILVLHNCNVLAGAPAAPTSWLATALPSLSTVRQRPASSECSSHERKKGLPPNRPRLDSSCSLDPAAHLRLHRSPPVGTAGQFNYSKSYSTCSADELVPVGQVLACGARGIAFQHSATGGRAMEVREQSSRTTGWMTSRPARARRRPSRR